jgi:hypothetical protein
MSLASARSLSSRQRWFCAAVIPSRSITIPRRARLATTALMALITDFRRWLSRGIAKYSPAGTYCELGHYEIQTRPLGVKTGQYPKPHRNRLAIPLTARTKSGKPAANSHPKSGQVLERVKGIEPSSSAWKAVALPLSYTRARDRHRPVRRAAWSHEMPPETRPCNGSPISRGAGRHPEERANAAALGADR